MVVTFSGMVSVPVKLVQLEKALLPMDVKAVGSERLPEKCELEKADSPIVVMLEGRLSVPVRPVPPKAPAGISVSCVELMVNVLCSPCWKQPLKAYSPIEITEAGMVKPRSLNGTLVKAQAPMVCTFLS